MRFGHAIALCLLALALVGTGLVYWDLQDGNFSTSLLFLPILTGTMAVALLLFPGSGPGTAGAVIRDPGTAQAGSWIRGIPVLHRRAWVMAAWLAIYLEFWARRYLEGTPFFTLSEQLTFFGVSGVLVFFLRKELRRMW